MAYSKNLEDVAYKAVEDGELEIDAEGRIWRVAFRRGDRWGRGTTLCSCPRRRAEKLGRDYLQIRVMYSGVRVNPMAHRLVYRHFNGQIPEGLTVNHKNGIKTDNRPENLELMTPSE